MIDNRTAPYAALLLRLALGTMFIAHAGLKYYVFTLPGTAQFFQSLGLPPVLAYLTFWAELAGGAAILVGLYSRWVSRHCCRSCSAPPGRTPPTVGSSPRPMAAGNTRCSSLSPRPPIA